MACNIDIEYILARAHGLAVYPLACNHATSGIGMVLLVDYTRGIGQDKLYTPIIDERVINSHIAAAIAYRHLIINR